MTKITKIIERSVFGVCEYIADKIGIRTSRVRMYFIYLSFFAFGSPVIIYFFLAFWLNIKSYIRRRKNILWE